MACGLPAIVGFSSSLPEVAGGASLLVDPYKSGEIARAIEKILSDDNFKNDLIERGKKKASEFNWEKTAGEYFNVFREF